MSHLSFTVSRLPQIDFGHQAILRLAQAACTYGQSALLVTGAGTLTRITHWPTCQEQFATAAVSYQHCIIDREPSPDQIDELVARYYGQGIELVIGIGGGSVLDGAKAIAGLLPFGNSVRDHLEGVGRAIPYHGPALPFIAVPTTAGTGSEATKNAVLSEVGPHGYKKSFRHDSLVPQRAIVDPSLLETCPPALIAANGMDALTQLLESYVSTKASPVTDALALRGLAAVRDGLFPAWRNDPDTGISGRENMALAALLSGITLAQAGLGAVHGLASPLGAFFPIAHGVVCGALVAAATAVNITAMRHRDPQNRALSRYAEVGRLLSGDRRLTDREAQDQLVSLLTAWTRELGLPRLATLGVRRDDFARIVANSRGNSMQTNPIRLSDDEITAILEQCC